MTEAQLRELMVERSASLYQRGFSVGSAGNISAAVEDGFLITPTNSSLGFLDPQRISKLDRGFNHVAGDPPSKEVFLHRAFYETVAKTGRRRPSPFDLCDGPLLSRRNRSRQCDAALDALCRDARRAGEAHPLCQARRSPDGRYDPWLGGKFTAVLLANHGPVVAGPDLLSAIYAAEELEETAKLIVTLSEQPSRLLTKEHVDELIAVFRK